MEDFISGWVGLRKGFDVVGWANEGIGTKRASDGAGKVSDGTGKTGRVLSKV